MNTIDSEWTNESRIGNNIPLYDKSTFLEIETYIMKKCAEYELTCKYNVGPLIGGVPPRNDNTKVVNDVINAISYHDSMGGILISTRNAEINCRNIDAVLSQDREDDISDILLEKLNDKYILETPSCKYDHIVFLPGSNLFHSIDWEKLDEALVDNPLAMIKLHPVITDKSANDIKEKWPGRVIDQNVSGLQLLNSSKSLWTSYNSEFGLIASLKKKPFAILSKWNDVFPMIYSPVYRNLKYKNVEYNQEVVSKVISSKRSGFIFPWQTDWKQRINLYFELIHKFKSGMEYPYV